jgi:hypothetical protein
MAMAGSLLETARLTDGKERLDLFKTHRASNTGGTGARKKIRGGSTPCFQGLLEAGMVGIDRSQGGDHMELQVAVAVGEELD